MKSSTKPNFKEKLYQFTRTFSLHGFKNVFQHGETISSRVIWLAILLAMFGLGATLMVDTINSYLRYDYVTKIYTKNENKIEFPSITLCPLHDFSNSTLDEYPSYKEYLYTLEALVFTGGNDSVLAERTENVLNASEQFLQDYGNLPLHSFYQAVMPSIEDVFLSCRIVGNVEIPCSDYVSYTQTSKGVCHTFNSKEVIHSIGPLEIHNQGYVEEVSFTLNAGIDEYFLSNTQFQSVGYLLSLHTPGVFPTTASNGITVTAGDDHMITAHTKVSKRLNKPYSKLGCIDKDEYNRPKCFLDCIADRVLSSCDFNCKYEKDHPNECTVREYSLCFQLSIADTQDLYEWFIQCQCKPACEETTYETKLSTSDFPTQHTVTIARRNNWTYQSFTDIDTHYLNLHVYFTTFDKEYMVETPAMGVDEVVSNIGGALALCLGASLITWAEFMDFLFDVMSEFCYSRWYRRKGRQQVTTIDIRSHVSE